jgi:hypothetical protein
MTRLRLASLAWVLCLVPPAWLNAEDWPRPAARKAVDDRKPGELKVGDKVYVSVPIPRGLAVGAKDEAACHELIREFQFCRTPWVGVRLRTPVARRVDPRANRFLPCPRSGSRVARPQPSMKELLSSHRRCGFLAVGSTLIPLAVGVGRPGPSRSDASTWRSLPHDHPPSLRLRENPPTCLTSRADGRPRTLHHLFGVKIRGLCPT